jgi:hypothetical protein
MAAKLIVTLTSFLIFLFTIRKGERLRTLLAGGLIVAFVFTWLPLTVFPFLAHFVYIIIGGVVFYRGVTLTRSEKIVRFSILSHGIFAVVTQSFVLFHLPFSGELKLSLIIPLIVYIIALFHGLKKEKEFETVSIFSIDFVFRVISLL